MSHSGPCRKDLVLASLFIITVISRASTQQQPEPDMSKFVPSGAQLIRELKVNLDKGRTSVVLAYAPGTGGPYVDTKVRVLQYDATGWKVGFEEGESVVNGAGPSDAIRIEKVTSVSGKEGVVVISKTSGAGTATDWHMLTKIAEKIVTLDSTRIREGVLKASGYVFQGYNGVTVRGDLVIEDLLGYSRGQARCCPDKPPIKIATRFTGTSLILDSVTIVRTPSASSPGNTSTYIGYPTHFDESRPLREILKDLPPPEPPPTSGCKSVPSEYQDACRVLADGTCPLGHRIASVCGPSPTSPCRKLCLLPDDADYLNRPATGCTPYSYAGLDGCKLLQNGGCPPGYKWGLAGVARGEITDGHKGRLMCVVESYVSP